MERLDPFDMVPDYVPDALLARYEAEARQRVRQQRYERAQRRQEHIRQELRRRQGAASPAELQPAAPMASEPAVPFPVALTPDLEFRSPPLPTPSLWHEVVHGEEWTNLAMSLVIAAVVAAIVGLVWFAFVAPVFAALAVSIVLSLGAANVAVARVLRRKLPTFKRATR